MATRRSFLAGLGIGLFSAAAAWADPPGVVSAPVPAGDAVNTVRQYLAFRGTNEWTKAYALLSADTQAYVSFDQFQQVKTWPADPTKDNATPLLIAINAFFLDAGDRLGYQYQVVGIAPEDPHIVLVSAQPHSAGANVDTKPQLLHIVTAPDPQTHTPRIKWVLSFLKTDPADAEKARERARQTTSLSNLKQIALAMFQYLQDHNEKYPAAERWVDAITPYLVDASETQARRQQILMSLFHDPSAPDSQKWSYAFNSNLSGLPLSQVDKPSTTVLLFESNANVKNAADTGESIPHPGRHSGGTDYALADGHAKYYRDTMSEADRRQYLSFLPTGD